MTVSPERAFDLVIFRQAISIKGVVPVGLGEAIDVGSIIEAGGGDDSEQADIWVDAVPGGWRLHLRGLGGALSPVLADSEVAEALIDAGSRLAMRRDAGNWHIKATAITIDRVGIVLLGERRLRHAVGSAAASRGATVRALDHIAVRPRCRAMCGDQWVPGTRSHASTDQFVVDAVVELRESPRASELLAIHPTAAIPPLIRASADLDRLGAPGLDRLVRLVSGSTAWMMDVVDPEAAAMTLADLYEVDPIPCWSGRDPLDAVRRLGWVGGAGLTFDSTEARVSLADPNYDERFMRVGASVPGAAGLPDGPPPWRTAQPPPVALDQDLMQTLGALAKARIPHALLGCWVDRLECTDVGSPNVDRDPPRVLVQSQDLERARARSGRGVEVISVLPGIDPSTTAELLARSVPVRLPQAWTTGLDPLDRFLTAGVAAGQDASDEVLWEFVAHAPADSGQIDKAEERARKLGIEPAPARVFRRAAAQLGGLPEIWHQDLYGRPYS